MPLEISSASRAVYEFFRVAEAAVA